MHLQHLTSVDGEIVWDVDPDVVAGARGRVYLREGLTVDDGARLARAATDRAALFEERVVGAAATIRPRLIDTVEETLARFRDEVGELEAADRFHPADEPADPAPGVVAAIDAWFDGLAGRRVALVGLDDLGLSVADSVVDRGGRVVGVSNRSGAVATSAGLDPRELRSARSAHGDLFITDLGLELHLPDELLGLAVDAILIGGGVGVVDRELAGVIGADVVVPTSDAAYTAGGLDELRRRRVVPLPDLATTAGPMLEASAPGGLTPAERTTRAERLIADRLGGARLSKVDPVRYVETLADTFATTWVPDGARSVAQA